MNQSNNNNRKVRTLMRSAVLAEIKSQLPLLLVSLTHKLRFRGGNRFSGLLLKHKPAIGGALCPLAADRLSLRVTIA